MAVRPTLKLVPQPDPVPEIDKPTKPKRAAGSYRKRGENSYQLRYRGKSKTIIAPNDTQAERALAAFIGEVDKGKFKPPAKMTVKELAERFLRDNPDLSPATRDNYKIHLDKRILPVFGDNKVDKIKPAHIYDFLDNLKEDGIREDGKSGGLSAATIRKNFNVLSSMFSFAVETGELDENPCNRVKPPKIPKRKPVSLDVDPAQSLLNALAEESLKYRVITIIAACTGMRRGEILGIGKSTIDLENYYIAVQYASRHRTGEETILKDPKSEAGIRIIPFPAEIVPLIQEQIAAQEAQQEKCGDKWISQVIKDGEQVENDLLFTQWNGKPMHPNSVDTWFRKFKEVNNLPDNLTFHGLRHTNITHLLKAGVDVGSVADFAGHSKKSTTLAYDDPLPSASREVANKISDTLNLKDTVPNLLGLPVNKRRGSNRNKNKDRN